MIDHFTYRRLNTGLGWMVCIIAFITYALTCQRTMSFWDSGEFIAASFKMQVTHPPGSPFYILLNHLFLSLFPDKLIAFGSNLFSSICAALTILFLFWTISSISKNIMSKDGQLSIENSIVVFGSAIVGALAFTFSHSFWVSATESEVYALATLLISVILWSMLKWREKHKETSSVRWLFFVALLTGLAASVHLMNMAVIFPVSMIYFSTKEKTSIITLCKAVFSGLLIFILMNNILFQGIVSCAAWLELRAVNNLGLAYNSGPVILLLAIGTMICSGLYYSVRKRKLTLYKEILLITFFLIGLSPYATVMIRSQAETPISNNASDIFRFLSYIKTEQYAGFADRPLLFGKFYNSTLDRENPYRDGNPVYVKDVESGKYRVSNDMINGLPNYSSKHNVLFSRMYSSDNYDRSAYDKWAKPMGEELSYMNEKGEVLYTIKPNLRTNLAFFFKFQFGWLNLRYLLSNFSGRQNDNKGLGDALNGNWISGLDFIDRSRVGSFEKMPDRYKYDKSRNPFYMIPLLLGMFGAVFLFRRFQQYFWIVTILFLAMGLAITVYINQVPSVTIARERDYIFLGSYYAFALFIGLGVTGIYKTFKTYWKPKLIALTVVIASFFSVPFLMAVQSWDDHHRSNDNFARVLGKAFLDSCAPGSILISAGDNITFPIWCLQETENYRSDVRVIDYELLSQDWYIDRLRRKVNNSDSISLSLPGDSYMKGLRDLIPLKKENLSSMHMEINQCLETVLSDKDKTIFKGRDHSYMPTDHFRITLDTSSFRQLYGMLPDKDYKYASEITWKYSKSVYSKSDLILMDILNMNIENRPIYFANSGNKGHFLGLDQYLIEQGVVSQLAPVIDLNPGEKLPLVDSDRSYSNLMYVYEFETVSDSMDYVNYLNSSLADIILRPRYANLALKLVKEENDSLALEVLQRCMELMPDHTVAFKDRMLPIAHAYMEAGQIEKGQEIVLKIISNTTDELELYFSFEPSNYKIQKEEIQKRMELYYKCLQLISDVVKKDFGKSLENEFKSLVNRFDRWMNRYRSS